MRCRQCNGERRVLVLRQDAPQLVTCPLCRGTGLSDRQPIKLSPQPPVMHEDIQQWWQRNGEKW